MDILRIAIMYIERLGGWGMPCEVVEIVYKPKNNFLEIVFTYKNRVCTLSFADYTAESDEVRYTLNIKTTVEHTVNYRYEGINFPADIDKTQSKYVYEFASLIAK